MFSFRRKPKAPEEPQVRASPSLPELNSQGIPWPANLVDISSIRESVDTTANLETTPKKGAAKISFGSDSPRPVPFHKPFRSPGQRPETTISSMYMTSPPSAFENWKGPGAPPMPGSKYSQRRARLPPTFNLMVVGGQGTGKTSLLRLLLETADISPAATAEQRTAVHQFLKGSAKPTPGLGTATVEISESRFERVLLSVIDTPGLDFAEGKELKQERQVTSMLRYLDSKYADTMSEESKVVRQSKGDQHVHLCIYLIDPSSIISATARRDQSSLPSKTRSEATVSQHIPPDLVPDNESDDDDEDTAPLTMSPAEIRVIRRLSTRVNVLPIIARADSLTDDSLAAIKAAVRAGLSEAGLDFGVFAPKKKETHAEPNGASQEPGSSGEDAEHGEGDEEEERQSRPVIKLRPARHGSTRQLSRSRSRRELSVAANEPEALEPDSVANIRFSAHAFPRSDLSELLPFAVIAPQSGRKRHHAVDPLATVPSSPAGTSEDGHVRRERPVSADASSSRQMHTPITPHGVPDDLKGVFVRKYRWGTIDVLDPTHCDFSALRTAVLSTHLRLLKVHTKEVLYEKFRTEKLLARRASRQVSEEQQAKISDGASKEL
ncbi:hypothetical protein CYLTODRAFT_383319 [Cylindrobasidium torrendii FP15055 ss-10]|uniref:Septin-type G domain-containing protein n=1 Tax=Cylindrobasidium torrendii FP15055 ss-10 TaxID=1314674 RepID=A0A0D7AXE6_9AGAR|nr:hypothetical protein CYLTODRAFT_383319 [Cylindrobasidium torrendii FP15055 ss-10]